MRPYSRSCDLRRRSAIFFCCAMALVIGSTPLFGGEVSLTPPSFDSLSEPALRMEDGNLQLSLEEAIEIALDRNLGLILERYNWVQTQTGELEAHGIYDPTLNAFTLYSDDSQASASVIEGVPVRTTQENQFNAGISQLTPYGGTATASLFLLQRETNSQNSALNPLAIASGSFSYTQPLLRGFGKLSTERSIYLARNNTAVSQETFRQRIAETIQSVGNAYWQLVEALEQERVAQEALSLAQELHDQNKVRVDVGTIAPLELTQSEAGIAGREEGIILAEADVEGAYDALRTLLNLEQGSLWTMPIVPTTASGTDRIEVDLDEQILLAVENRSELRARALQVENLRLDTEFLTLETKPQVDLKLTYGLSGLGGDRIIFDPNTGAPIGKESGGIGDALDQVAGFDFENWEVRVDFRYPLINRRAKAQKLRAEYALDEGRTDYERLRQQVIQEVRTAVRSVETTTKQIESAKASRILSEKNLEAEKRRYEYGLSTSYLVLDRQQDLTSAASREVSAITAYRRAEVELYRATGRLLEIEGVEIAD